MSHFEYLQALEKYSHDAFGIFYEKLLKEIQLSTFFKDDEQIKQLVHRLKINFIATLSMDIDAIKENYTQLGTLHYDLRIPYIELIKGTDIIEEYFLLQTQQGNPSTKMMREIFAYFKLSKSSIAKGYLDRIIQEDKRELQSFLEQVEQSSTYLPKQILLTKIEWLQSLIVSIEHKRPSDEWHNIQTSQKWLSDSALISSSKINFFKDLEDRILINAKNFFYFLKKEEYEEVLPLYSSLISSYKLILMVNNSMNLEYSSQTMVGMELDPLTQLYKKDFCDEILYKEFEFQKRESDYNFSLIYFDIDNFKSINNHYGHYSGDKVIEKLGEIIGNNIRSSDYGFRLNGDHFAIILKNAKRYIARKIAKKIALDVGNYSFIFNKETIFYVTLSIGITEQSHVFHHETTDSLREALKQNLHRAKTMGGNQICI